MQGCLAVRLLKRNYLYTVVVATGFLAFSSATVYADLYTITNLNNMVAGQSQNEGAALDINESGQIVGYFGMYRSFLYSDGTVSMFVPPSGPWPYLAGYGDSWASGINNDGQVVGLMASNFYGNYELRNYSFDQGVLADLGTITSTGYGQYPDINDSGQFSLER